MQTDSAIEVIARDMGIFRYKEEVDDSFIRRIVYSGSRFWLEATCLDDGIGGFDGVSRSVLASRLRKWINSLLGFYPFLVQDVTRSMVNEVCDSLMMCGDIVSENHGETYRVTSMHRGMLPGRVVCVLGMCDLPRMIDEDNVFLSGMMICSRTTESDTLPLHYARNEWWKLPNLVYTWTPISTLGDIRWFNSYSSGWSIFDEAAWSVARPVDGEIWLANVKNRYVSEYYMVKKMYGQHYATRITKEQAGDLLLAIRHLSGNNVRGTYEKIDQRYARIIAPFYLLPPEIMRWIRVMTWEEMGSAIHRIIRIECLDSIRVLLEESNITLSVEE